MREYGSEHQSIILPDGYFQTFEDYRKNVVYLRCGREALLYVALILKNRLSHINIRNPKILFPAYCCWSMSAPFVKAGWQIVYYRLNEDLTIDSQHLNDFLEEYHPHAVLTMNYYGSAFTDEAIRLIKDFDANISVIEDFSHCTFSFASIFNPNVDYYVSSLRKSIGIPDGAIVLSKEETDKSMILPADSEFVDRRLRNQMLKAAYAFTNNQDSKSSFLTALRDCEHQLDRFDCVHHISAQSREMLGLINGKMIAAARRENMEHLWTLLNGRVEMVPGLERSFDGAPFSLPIRVKNRDAIQTELARKGLYTQLLWPVSDEAKAVCKVSKRMNEEMLSVPIDQRYDWNDIEDIANILLTTV